jgi:chloride channel 7
MSQRVRKGNVGGSPAPTRPSLIAYADPKSFITQSTPTHTNPTPNTQTTAAPPAQTTHTVTSHSSSDVYPVADADADPSGLPLSPQLPKEGNANDFPLSDRSIPPTGNEEDNVETLSLDTDESSTIGVSTNPTRRSKGGASSTVASRAGAALLSGLDSGSAAALAALRAKEDDTSTLVEDHILTSLDYDKDEDYVNEDFMEKRGALHMHVTLLLQFILTVLIAFVTAMLMWGVAQCMEALSEWRTESMLKRLEVKDAAGAYFTYLAISLLFTIIAATLVSVGAPRARGGGVPYVLAYLNGTNVMEYFSLRIVGIKTLSLIFTIAGGLTQGMEGPFVFIGGGVANILNQAMDILFPFFPRHSSYAKILRGIREERIFMAGGMAAGLAVAFDAPIAGVLFALEGATAFLSAPIVLRIFGCAMFASFFNDLGHTNFSRFIKNHNLLQASNSGVPRAYAWTIVEIFPFLLLGIIGGVAGAGATKINMWISRWRHDKMQGSSVRDVGKQIGEIALFCIATVTPFFILPFLFPCAPKHALCDVVVTALPNRCLQGFCEEGEYSQTATIVFSTANQIAALLFDRSLTAEAEFNALPLIIYGILYWLLVALLYGAYVPGGLFVPSIVVGGLYGRVIGIGVQAVFPLTYNINPGVYSLLGAASMLGGFTRLALPVVIMLVELTGDATYLLPMMLCSVVGKFTSDALEPPLYPQHMKLEHIPSLTDKLDPTIAKLTAKDIMLPADQCHPLVINTIHIHTECNIASTTHMSNCLYVMSVCVCICISSICVVESLSVLKSVLTQTSRIVFPVLTRSGTFSGLILRRNVMYCLSHSPTYSNIIEAMESNSNSNRSHSDEIRLAERHTSDWRSDKYDQAHTITRGSRSFEDAFVNLSMYVDIGCMSARPLTPAKRLAVLFRRVGLSHLTITDKNHSFLGLITRRQLITPPNQNMHTHTHTHAHAHSTSTNTQQQSKDTDPSTSHSTSTQALQQEQEQEQKQHQ